MRRPGCGSVSLLLAVTRGQVLAKVALIAVLPLPNRSYAAPRRSVMSFQRISSVDPAGKELRRHQLVVGPTEAHVGIVVEMPS